MSDWYGEAFDALRSHASTEDSVGWMAPILNAIHRGRQEHDECHRQAQAYYHQTVSLQQALDRAWAALDADHAHTEETLRDQLGVGNDA